jgi:hypothetical protein
VGWELIRKTSTLISPDLTEMLSGMFPVRRNKPMLSLQAAESRSWDAHREIH